MKINLKNHSKDLLQLLKLKKDLISNPELKKYSKLIGKVIRLHEEIEVDTELSGECILELDKPRQEAIEERNHMLSFIKEEDD